MPQFFYHSLATFIQSYSEDGGQNYKVSNFHKLCQTIISIKNSELTILYENNKDVYKSIESK